MLVGISPVRSWAAVASASVYETGDGKGAENAVSCHGANRLLLYCNVEDQDVVYKYKVEFYSGIDQPYGDTAGTLAGGVDSRVKLEYRVPTTNSPGLYYVIAVPVHGTWARVSVQCATAGKKVAITAATATTVGGEGRSWGPFLVKKPGALNGTGDGPGGQNPVPIHDASKLVLLLNPDLGASSRLDVYMETSINGRDYYRETVQSGSNPIDANGRTYQVSQSVMGENTPSIALAIEALGAFARFKFTQGVATVNGAAAKALVGRS